jgi:hypothetical protein
LTVEVTEQVYTVVTADGAEHYASPDEARVAARRGGGQMRTATRTVAVPGAYLVVDAAGEVLGSYDKAAEAARAAAHQPGAVVKIGPKPLR